MTVCLHALLVAGLIFFPQVLYAGGEQENKTMTENEVTVWTYDSFNSEWGPGPQVAENFKAETGITVRFVSQGDAGALLSRLLTEGTEAKADLVLGLDQNLMPRALESGLFQAYRPKNLENVSEELILDTSYNLIPFDYGYFAIIYDSLRISEIPKSLEDLTKETYRNRLILMDPRTSTPGLGFLAWTKILYGNSWKDYWRRLIPSILTVSDGWDTGYGLFTSGEAPLVLSYTTSPAYHLEYESTERFKAALFDEGHPVQIELAGLLAHGHNEANAKIFMDFMLSEGFQGIIPITNWMYPVIDIELPASFRLAPKSSTTLHTPVPTATDLSEWAALFAK